MVELHQLCPVHCSSKVKLLSQILRHIFSLGSDLGVWEPPPHNPWLWTGGILPGLWGHLGGRGLSTVLLVLLTSWVGWLRLEGRISQEWRWQSASFWRWPYLYPLRRVKWAGGLWLGVFYCFQDFNMCEGTRTWKYPVRSGRHSLDWN